MTDTPLLTTPEAAAYLRTSKASLYRLWSRGELRMTKVGASTRWRRSELDRYLAANERECVA